MEKSFVKIDLLNRDSENQYENNEDNNQKKIIIKNDASNLNIEDQSLNIDKKVSKSEFVVNNNDFSANVSNFDDLKNRKSDINQSSLESNQKSTSSKKIHQVNSSRTTRSCSNEDNTAKIIPVDIRWIQGGEKVFITGSFTRWQKMIEMSKQNDNNFFITLGLPVGMHRFRFVVDNELRFSDFLSTATDQMGNFVNYIEVVDGNIYSYLVQRQEEIQQSFLEKENNNKFKNISTLNKHIDFDSFCAIINEEDTNDKSFKQKDDSNEKQDSQILNYIPPIFTEPKIMEQYYIAIEKQSKSRSLKQSWLYPPHLPPHLENVILNNFDSLDKNNNSGALSIPTHVVLNHLITTNIKNSILAVAFTARYKRKYVTQILYVLLYK